MSGQVIMIVQDSTLKHSAFKFVEANLGLTFHFQGRSLYINIYICVCTHIYANIFIHMCTYIQTYYIYTHTHTYVDIYGYKLFHIKISTINMTSDASHRQGIKIIKAYESPYILLLNAVYVSCKKISNHLENRGRIFSCVRPFYE